jgi:arginase family enzyme
MNLLMDFTHTYTADWIASHNSFAYLDCSDISGTDMYCTPEAEKEIMDRIITMPEHMQDAYSDKTADSISDISTAVSGIHFIDSGNYHYVTGIFTKYINKPYNLLFFDNHTDMKPTLIPEFLSCGAWAERVLKTDSNLCHMIMIGPVKSDIAEAVKTINTLNKPVCISAEELAAYAAESKNLNCLLERSLKAVDMSLPLYISVDKDVLSGEYARTNWNQGEMTLDTLIEILEIFLQRLERTGGKVIGVDICGELPIKDSSFAESAEAGIINAKTNDRLIKFFEKSSQYNA